MANNDVNTLYGKTKDTSHPFPTVKLDPDRQHIPLRPEQSHLRPPPPILDPKTENDSIILVGAVTYRDWDRCGYTIFTALERAKYPDRVRVAVIDQALDDEGDGRCIQAYCDLATKHLKDNNTNQTEIKEPDCPRRDQIIIDERDARTFSKGPLIARHYLQLLVRDEHEFCLGIDGHSLFTNDWDVYLLKDWRNTENEMAVISTYIHDSLERVITLNGDNNPWDATPHICDIKAGSHSLPRNEGATTIKNATRPNLTSKWGAGFSFSKCHSERRVPIDLHAEWIFDGEEFSRAALLFMAGYDMYSPSMNGHAIYHNYTSTAKKKTWWAPGRGPKQIEEEEKGANRIKLHIGMPFEGKVNTHDFSRFDALSGDIPVARSLDQFLEFTGVGYRGANGGNWTHRCHQVHWVPYEHPEVVEAVVPGWTQDLSKHNHSTANEVPDVVPVTSVDRYQTGFLYDDTRDQMDLGSLTYVLSVTNLVIVCWMLLRVFCKNRRK